MLSRGELRRRLRMLLELPLPLFFLFHFGVLPTVFDTIVLAHFACVCIRASCGLGRDVMICTHI